MVRLQSFPVFMILLFAAIVIYALAGSPTPDDPGAVEMIIGVLLAGAVGLSGLHRAADISVPRPAFLIAVQVMLFCGFTIPVLSALYYGTDVMLILRDLAAFAFLGLPLFLAARFARNPEAQIWLCRVLVFAGICFCIRTLLPAFNIWAPDGELLYLSNSPLALFAATYLAGSLWERLSMPSRRNLLLAAACLLVMAVIIGAMLLDVQRATVGAVFLTLIAHALIALVKTPGRAVVPVLILAALTAVCYPLVAESFSAMARKTADVGLNMRTQEAAAVIAAVKDSPLSLFFGQGWGAVFASPAVAGLDVNYTHSLLTTMLLKGGIVLFLAAGVMVVTGLYQIFLIFQRDRVRGLALFWPFLIPVLLYASHKSLDFGLLLLLTGVWSVGLQALPEGGGSATKSQEHPQKS